MNRVLRAYDLERKRQVIVGADYEVTRDGCVLRFKGPDAAAWNNGVIHSSLTAGDADAAIAQQVRYFTELGHAFEWKLHDYDTPSDLDTRLSMAGFDPDPIETLVEFDLTHEFPAPATPGVEVACLEDVDQFDRLIEATAAAHGSVVRAEALVRALRIEKRTSPELVSVYVARVEQRVVASGWLRISASGTFGSLWGGGTDPTWRRRGLYSALVGARLDEARRRGCTWVTVDCGPESLPILERKGFRQLATITPWIYSPHRSG